MVLPGTDLFAVLSFLYCLLIGCHCSAVSKKRLNKLLIVPLHILIAFANILIKYYYFERDYFHALQAGAIIHVSSWFIQVVIGHFCIENNSPGMRNKLTIYSIIISNSLALETFINQFIDLHDDIAV